MEVRMSMAKFYHQILVKIMINWLFYVILHNTIYINETAKARMIDCIFVLVYNVPFHPGLKQSNITALM